MKLRKEAREVLNSNATEDFQMSKEYLFGSKLVDVYERLDLERLQYLKATGNDWAMMLSSIARVGRKLTFEGLEDKVEEGSVEIPTDDFR